MRLRRLHPAGHCVLLVSASLPALPEIHRRERLVSPLDKDAGREAVRAEALCCALQQDRARTGDSLRASAPDALTRPRCKPLRLACGDAPKVRGSCQNGVSSLDGIPSLEARSHLATRPPNSVYLEVGEPPIGRYQTLRCENESLPGRYGAAAGTQVGGHRGHAPGPVFARLGQLPQQAP
ncbi:unnamed protein product [Effrenium voratum]|nr:unnamed protein product [Effrenium voratum]